MAEMTKESDKVSLKDEGFIDWSALTAVNIGRAQAGIIVLVAVLIIAGLEIMVRGLNIPQYVFPAPSAIARALVQNFPTIRPHLFVTLQQLFLGYVIGASIGIILAAIITQFPFMERVITPYVLVLVMTPAVALVPLLILRFGFGMTPRIIAIALAVGPMVMINASTGFRRTDNAKIALARSYGATTLQIFTRVRFPLALPMIIVGLMVGAIFGLVTGVGAEMVGGGMGLGTRLTYYSSLARMAPFFAVIVIIATIGILVYVLFYYVGKKWASWEA
jgi:NitT/TauT family transport system permease protein